MRRKTDKKQIIKIVFEFYVFVLKNKKIYKYIYCKFVENFWFFKVDDILLRI